MTEQRTSTGIALSPDAERVFRDAGIDAATLAGGQLGRRLGIVLTEAAAERTTATMPVEGNRQPYGVLHGGASAALAETVGSVAAMLHAGPGRIALGVDLNCTHHRAARDGLLTATATPLHLGRTTATYDIALTDEQGRRVCTARLTCALRDA